MNQKILYLLSALPVIFSLASCSTVEEITGKTETRSRSIDYYDRRIEKEGINQKPLVADLDVSKQKLSFSRTYEKISADEAKDYVTAEFAMGQNCDVIVHPIYETVTTNTDGNVKVDVTITGYPAFYRNIRNFQPGDVSAWQLYSFFSRPAPEVEKAPDTAAAVTVVPIQEQIVQTIRKRSRTRFGISADYALLNSPDKDYYENGIGGSMMFLTKISKSFYYTMNFSYLYFSGKEVFGMTVDPFHFGSGNLGFRYKSPINLYAEARAGYGEILQDDGSGGVIDDGGFNYALSVGFHYKSLDISVRKEKTNNIDFEFTGLRLGVYF